MKQKDSSYQFAGAEPPADWRWRHQEADRFDNLSVIAVAVAAISGSVLWSMAVMDPEVRRERIEARWEETQEQAKVIASWGFPLWRIATALD